MALFLPSVVFADRSNDAVTWLINHQNPDGSWGKLSDGIDSRIYSTSIVIQALEENGVKINKSLYWISGVEPYDTAALAKSSEVIHKQGRVLNQRQNNDGGWGKTDSHKSTPWYTSVSLISQLDSNLTSAKLGGDFLIRLQEDSGEWSNSSLITSNCVYALLRLYNYTREDRYLLAALKGKKWLEESKHDDFYTINNMVLVYKLLYSLLQTESLKASYQDSQMKLLKRQNSDGSWSSSSEGEPLATALALTALSREFHLIAIRPRISLEVFTLKERYIAGSLVNIIVKLENQGFLDIEDLEVVVEIPAFEIEKSVDMGHLGRGKGKKILTDFLIGEREGTYTLKAYARYAVESGKNYSTSAEGLIKLQQTPIKFELYPKKLKRNVSQKFLLSVENEGITPVQINNISLLCDKNWKDIEINSSSIYIAGKSKYEFEVFKAITPDKIGEYQLKLVMDLNHSQFGKFRIFHEEKLLVGGMIPSGIVNLILYSTVIASAFLILNLFVGFDILE